MLIFLPVMLCSSAQIFDLLCSILCSCKRFVLKNLAVLLEYIHLHHKNFNAVTVLLHILLAQIIIIVDVLLEYIDLQSYFQSSTTYYAGIILDALSYSTYYAHDYAGILGWSLLGTACRLYYSY